VLWCRYASSSLEVKIETDSNDALKIKTEADSSDRIDYVPSNCRLAFMMIYSTHLFVYVTSMVLTVFDVSCHWC